MGFLWRAGEWRRKDSHAPATPAAAKRAPNQHQKRCTGKKNNTAVCGYGAQPRAPFSLLLSFKILFCADFHDMDQFTADNTAKSKDGRAYECLTCREDSACSSTPLLGSTTVCRELLLFHLHSLLLPTESSEMVHEILKQHYANHKKHDDASTVPTRIFGFNSRLHFDQWILMRLIACDFCCEIVRSVA